MLVYTTSTQAAETRAGLLAAATRVLHERGLAGFSVRNVAAAAGVSHMGIYRYFGSIEALGDAVARAGESKLRSAIPGVVTHESPGAAMVTLARVYVDFCRENRGLWSLWEDERFRGSVKPVVIGLLELSFDRLCLDDSGRAEPATGADGRTCPYVLQLATAVNGFLRLESAGAVDPEDVDRVLVPMLTDISRRLSGPGVPAPRREGLQSMPQAARSMIRPAT
ncbi:TetR/AcrR family transcriptional regulator [Nocardioides jiangxiensis]|uniref:TetR/AcrR family transcriptional regulator n=1 Tax=Nocardioides jiangxiensis TaxID=3064524 RepID=A0ABT9AXY3_9ACTN|nr:TetR/AcrR family transcriptional regulator [Nocardioides sp. WY-20]MDO7867247.1 TetR/AcrR family transcriptional regulator [Nocardioides sp. WY-20]